jgi:hypothetical protein
VTCPDLRRANATTRVAEGVDLKTARTRLTVLTRLGHSDPHLTLAVCGQVTTEGDRRTADQVAARLMPAASTLAMPPAGAHTGCAHRCATEPDPATAGAGHKICDLRASSREGGIRTRGLSGPNAARDEQP